MVNATIYSIVETAKANKVNIRIYLQYILEQMSSRRVLIKPYDDEFMNKMMPRADEYKEYEKNLLNTSIDSFRKMFPEPDKPGTPLKTDVRSIAAAESALFKVV